VSFSAYCIFDSHRLPESACGSPKRPNSAVADPRIDGGDIIREEVHGAWEAVSPSFRGGVWGGSVKRVWERYCWHGAGGTIGTGPSFPRGFGSLGINLWSNVKQKSCFHL